MRKRIFFRADGTVQMGLGHLIRSRALADMLFDTYEISFVSQHIADAVRSEFIDSGYTSHIIASESEFLDMIGYDDLVVLDGYQFGLELQDEIKKQAKALICIDDLMEPECHADLIINQSPGVSPTDYKALPGTLFALGTDYTLLRAPFLESARSDISSGDKETVFICFGGSDAQDLIKSTWEIVRNSGLFRRIILVTGASYQHLASLLEHIDGDAATEHHHHIDAKKMCNLMMESGLKIVPSSGILFEAIATGGTVISGYYTNNQIPNYQHFLELRAIIDAGTFQPEMVEKALNVRPVFSEVNKVIDGRSRDRFRDLFFELENRIKENVLKTT